MKTQLLPRLPFGELVSQHGTGVNALRDLLAQQPFGNWDFAPIGKDKERFAFKCSSVAIGGTHVFTGITTPAYERRDERPCASFVVPFFGSASIRADRKPLQMSPGKQGILMSGAPWEGTLGNITGLVAVPVDPTRLSTVMTAMRGFNCEQDASRWLVQDREVPFHAGPMSFSAVLNNAFALVDIMASQPDSLSLLAIDDTLYRCFAMMLAPHLFFESQTLSAAQRSHGRSRLDIVCDYIQSRIAEPITLTELENLSGLSARALQYAFAREFQCTPLEWIRNSRLSLARERLSTARPGQTVLSIALACGFTNPGRFANLYLKRFGEPPFTTLRRTIDAHRAN